MLRRGSRGRKVMAMQAFLTDTGAYGGWIDGIYGPKTEAAVRDWQGLIGEKTDGMWGPKTNHTTLQYVDKLTKEISEVDRNRQPVVPTMPMGGRRG